MGNWWRRRGKSTIQGTRAHQVNRLAYKENKVKGGRGDNKGSPPLVALSAKDGTLEPGDIQ